jgi:hypothetical protein
MIHPLVLTQEKPVPRPWIVRARRKPVNRSEILDVLDRAATDSRFIAQLTDQGLDALSRYDLTCPEKAALLSGDIRWIEAHIGKLSTRQRTWLECRLQQEIW